MDWGRDGGQMSEVGSRMSDVGGRRAGVRTQDSENERMDEWDGLLWEG